MTAHDNLAAFWLYVIAWAQACYIEQLELKAFCERNANRRHRPYGSVGAAREGSDE